MACNSRVFLNSRSISSRFVRLCLSDCRMVDAGFRGSGTFGLRSPAGSGSKTAPVQAVLRLFSGWFRQFFGPKSTKKREELIKKSIKVARVANFFRYLKLLFAQSPRGCKISEGFRIISICVPSCIQKMKKISLTVRCGSS